MTRCIVLVKEHFFLLHLWPLFSRFLPSNALIMLIIFAIVDSSFLKVIDEQNTLRIPKYGGPNLGGRFGRFERLSPVVVHSADCRFDSEGKWWVHVLSIVTYLHRNYFYCVETIVNNALNRRRVVVFDRHAL